MIRVLMGALLIAGACGFIFYSTTGVVVTTCTANVTSSANGNTILTSSAVGTANLTCP